MDASDRKLIGDIERYGRHVVTVSSAAGEQGEPPFAYPVGLQKSLGLGRASLSWPRGWKANFVNCPP